MDFNEYALDDYLEKNEKFIISSLFVYSLLQTLYYYKNEFANATIKIIEKDDDGNDDEVTTLPAKVQNGKIECKWKVIYTEDDDDSNSQQEKEEKGYTLPEYAFTVECGGTESGESGQLNVMGWIKKQIVFNNSKNGAKNLNYEIIFPDGAIIHGEINDGGFIDLKDIKSKYYKIRLTTN